jgi:hypothetical protein
MKGTSRKRVGGPRSAVAFGVYSGTRLGTPPPMSIIFVIMVIIRSTVLILVAFLRVALASYRDFSPEF